MEGTKMTINCDAKIIAEYGNAGFNRRLHIPKEFLPFIVPLLVSIVCSRGCSHRSHQETGLRQDSCPIDCNNCRRAGRMKAPFYSRFYSRMTNLGICIPWDRNCFGCSNLHPWRRRSSGSFRNRFYCRNCRSATRSCPWGSLLTGRVLICSKDCSRKILPMRSSLPGTRRTGCSNCRQVHRMKAPFHNRSGSRMRVQVDHTRPGRNMIDCSNHRPSNRSSAGSLRTRCPVRSCQSANRTYPVGSRWSRSVHSMACSHRY